MKFLKLILFTIVGFVLFFAGVGFLIDGIFSRKLMSAGFGALAIALLAVWLVRTVASSKREQKAQTDVINAKLAEGKWLCGACEIEFEDATSRKTSEPWYHMAVGMALALAFVALGALGLYGLGFSSFDSVKAVIILLGGIGIFVFVLQGRRRIYIRCPQCGRSCGWEYRT